ncbi:MAG TPA: metallophosphoesterase family protein [Phenylobacterium sp.]|uniref:metallophosphoesterase family protein n=1 Tax=Phenylobacterium sp. TaxID=1871053 RepID=UPI002BD7D237|nr:metallophosphoesterase family protein [Phenylobacterium sp.]HSV01731.1 metallophosphoesterase family protein [Phenylobacterium sp.]
MPRAPGPRLTDGRLIYAIGDVHGCYELLRDLLALIARDDAGRGGRGRPLLVFLGDYVDRGLQSARVVEALVWLQRRPDLEVRLLKGNHEQALLEFLDAPERAGLWLGFGGAETLAAYGVIPPRADDRPCEFVRARDELLDRMPAAHLKLLQGLELMVEAGDYVFVHAGVRPGVPLERQTERDLLWIRKGFLDAAGPFEKVVVHGHTWEGEAPQLLAHRLGLDTGAYATGVLTALRLCDGEREVLQARRPVEDVWTRRPLADLAAAAERARETSPQS